ncbi:MAG: hypothetical protein JWQ87_2017 [Candidatus Sulfotelmatobacter sp.]|nr:hypothetical protein [Candidatus Sulfotelmatobacter sp.]
MGTQPNYEKIKEIASTDESFKLFVVEKITALDTNMDGLVGNGQPGRVKILEDKVEQHGRYIYGAIIGLVVLEGLFHWLASAITPVLHVAGR